jgi:hypothetical protein
MGKFEVGRETEGKWNKMWQWGRKLTLAEAIIWFSFPFLYIQLQHIYFLNLLALRITYCSKRTPKVADEEEKRI